MYTYAWPFGNRAYKGFRADGVFLVFSLRLYELPGGGTLDTLKERTQDVLECCEGGTSAVLIGNFADEEYVKLSPLEMSRVREFGVPFFKTSAKTGYNVEDALFEMAKQLKNGSKPLTCTGNYGEASSPKSLGAATTANSTKPAGQMSPVATESQAPSQDERQTSVTATHTQHTHAKAENLQD